MLSRPFHPQLGYGSVVQSEWADEESEIIGPRDSRSPVKKTTNAPWRWICQIIATYQNPALQGGAAVDKIGSGVLIGPRHVLTAAHNFRYEENGNIYNARAVTVCPGRSVGYTPFGSSRMVKANLPKEYVPGAASCFDYAVLTLEDDVGAQTFKVLKDRRLGYWGSRELGEGTAIEVIPASGLHKKTVHTAGYAGDHCGSMPIVQYKPGDRCYDGRPTSGSALLKQCMNNKLMGSSQFGSKGNVVAVRAGGPAQYLLYAADTCSVQSGSPVWLQSGGKRILVGIHTGAFDPARGTCEQPNSSAATIVNRAVRLDDAVYRNIKLWTRPSG